MAQETLTPVAVNLRLARERKGLTQLALAHLIGYRGEDAGAAICRFEAGQQEPRLGTLRKMAHALGVDVCSLIEGKRK